MKRLICCEGIAVALAMAGVLPVQAANPVVGADGSVTYELAQAYEPFLTKTNTLIWANRNLSDIFAMTALNAGGWLGRPVVADGYFYNRTTNSVMVQLQADDGLCKTVRAYFTQCGNDIYGRADAAGYDNSNKKYTELDASLFFRELATSLSSGVYGSYHLLAYGDASGTVEGLPEAAPAITANDGTLQVNLSSDATVTNTLAGTGGFTFKGTVDDLNRDLSYAWPSTSAKTLATDTSVYDIEICSAVLNGSWCGRHEGAKPYFVTTNTSTDTITAQFQAKWWDSRGWWAWKAVGIELKQSGLDVTIRALWAATPISDSENPYGSDASKWNTWDVPVVTTADGKGYGLETIAFKAHGAPCATLTGAKTFANGLVADAARVILRSSQLPPHSKVLVRNGGELVVDASGSWSGSKYYEWSATQGSRLIFSKSLGCYQDKVLLDASEAVVLNTSTYMRELTLRNGSRIKGTKMRAVLYSNATWTSEGTNECQVLPLIGLCGSTSTLTVNAKGPIAFLGGVEKDDGCAGFRKTGDGTLRIAGAAWNITKPFYAAGGRIETDVNVTAGVLAVEDTTELCIAGAVVTFDDSSAQAWTAGKTLNLVTTGDGAKVRFGTSAFALTGAQRRALRLNGGRCHLDENGYVVAGLLGCMIIMR